MTFALSTVLAILSIFSLISIPRYSPNVFDVRGLFICTWAPPSITQLPILGASYSSKVSLFESSVNCGRHLSKSAFKVCLQMLPLSESDGGYSWFSWRKNSSGFACLDLQHTYKLEYNWIRSVNSVFFLFTLDTVTILLDWKWAVLLSFPICSSSRNQSVLLLLNIAFYQHCKHVWQKWLLFRTWIPLTLYWSNQVEIS